MAVHILSHADKVGLTHHTMGDLLVRHRPSTIESSGDTSLTWQVVEVVGPRAGQTRNLGAFAKKSVALNFALGYSASGWAQEGVLRRALLELLSYSPALPKQALYQLDMALQATPDAPPRVLIVVENGIAQVHASPEVDAVVVDVDTQREFSRTDLVPVHVEFEELLREAAVDWPVSTTGRRREGAGRTGTVNKRRFQLVSNSA